MKAASTNIAERLRFVRENMGIGQVEAAAKFGIPVSTYRKYESGPSEPGSEAIAGISRAGIDANWLLTGEGSMLRNSPAPLPGGVVSGNGYVRLSESSELLPPEVPPGFVFVPKYEVTASMGHGQIIHSEMIVDYLAFREDWLRNTLRLNPKDLFLINTLGDSMHPTLHSGDLVLIDQSTVLRREDNLWVFSHEGQLRVKRIQFRFNGSLAIISDNPQYKEEVVPQEQVESIILLGRVVWYGRCFV